MEVQQCVCGAYVKWAPGSIAPPCSSCGAYLRGQARPSGRLLGSPQPAAEPAQAEGVSPDFPPPLAPAQGAGYGPHSELVADGPLIRRAAQPLAALDPYAPVASRWKRDVELESRLFAIAAGIRVTALLHLAFALLVLAVAPQAWRFAGLVALFAGLELLAAHGLWWLRPLAFVGALLIFLPTAVFSLYLFFARRRRVRQLWFLAVCLAPCFVLWNLAGATSLSNAEYRQFMVEEGFPRPAYAGNRYFWMVIFMQGTPAILLALAILLG